MRPPRYSVVAALSVVLGAAACGTTPAPSPGDPSQLRTSSVLLERVASEINGTLQQNIAGEQLIYASLQGPLQTCMAEHGLHYQPPPFVTVYDAWDGMALPADSLALRPVSRTPSAHNGLGVIRERLVGVTVEGEAPNPGFDELTSDEDRAAYVATSDACVPPETEVEGAGRPGPDEVLDEAWLEFLASVDRIPAVAEGLEEYPACMAAHGFDVATIDEVRDQLIGMFQDPAADADTPASPGWVAIAQREEDAAEADYACRSAVHNLALVAAAQPLTEFQERYSDRIARRAEQWRDIADEAKARAAELRVLDPEIDRP